MNFTMMYSLKRKFSSKRRLNSSSSSTVGSVSDVEDRVIMMCEDVPRESSLDSAQSSHSLWGRSSRGSQGEEHDSGSEPHFIHLSRDRLSYRQACYAEEDPRRQYYTQRIVQVYERLLLCVL